jgi:lipoate-protein ligase A
MRGLLLHTPALNVFEHMAFDELMVFESGEDDVVLRFYNWGYNFGATFGYAQFHDEAVKDIPRKFEGKFTRRPTGGGIVLHDGDLTFSCIFKNSDKIKVQDIYDRFHKTISAELFETGFNSSLCSDKTTLENYKPSHNDNALNCFSSPVQSDLMSLEGKKVLGGALRKFKKKTLYQASLQSESARIEGKYKQAVEKAFCGIFNIGFNEENVGEGFLTKVREFAVSKYSLKPWIEKF